MLTLMAEKTFEWGDPSKGEAPCGTISIIQDKDGLPALSIDVHDDYYSGTLPYKKLFELITELALFKVKKKG